jgi:cytosine/adenosine deaminase-related metal-dependent hydrolase
VGSGCHLSIARRINAQEYQFAVLLACVDAIRNGTTAIADHPTHYARFHADESCRALITAGLRGAVARGGADQSLVDPGKTRPLSENMRKIRAFVERWQDPQFVCLIAFSRIVTLRLYRLS